MSAPSPPAPAGDLSRDEIQRYTRHLIMPEVGLDGQKKLKAASVLCIGAGGLGSPRALPRGGGVGTLGLVDFDVVDFRNLQRQILHGTPDVGRTKLASAAERLNDVNPNVHGRPYECGLSSDQRDLAASNPTTSSLDGTDNFPTRYLVNDACVLLGKPNVYGSIFRFEGQASVFWPEGPMLPLPLSGAAAAGAGALLRGGRRAGRAAGHHRRDPGDGDDQAHSRYRRAAHRAVSSSYDALEMRFREFKLRKNPDCVVCGPSPTVTRLIDYEEFCVFLGRKRRRNGRWTCPRSRCAS